MMSRRWFCGSLVPLWLVSSLLLVAPGCSEEPKTAPAPETGKSGPPPVVEKQFTKKGQTTDPQ